MSWLKWLRERFTRLFDKVLESRALPYLLTFAVGSCGSLAVWEGGDAAVREKVYAVGRTTSNSVVDGTLSPDRTKATSLPTAPTPTTPECECECQCGNVTDNLFRDWMRR